MNWHWFNSPDAASMPIVAGDGACLVDPFSVESIREGVLRVIHDTDFREALVRTGLLNTERFRPEKIAADYLKVYKGTGELKNQD